MFIDCLSDGAPVALADMGAGSGQAALNWFETMYPDLAEQGILFTANRSHHLTSDPASGDSVLAWAARLQNRVEYVIVENATTPQADFSYWRDSEQCVNERDGARRITLDPFVADAILEKRLEHCHAPHGGLGADRPGRAELAHIDWLPLVDHDVTALLGEFVEPRHQQAIFLVGGESGGFLKLVKKRLGRQRDRAAVRVGLGQGFWLRDEFSTPGGSRFQCRGNGSGIIPFPLVGTLAKELFVEGARDDDRAFSALPAPLPLLEFTGTRLAGMTGFALPAVTAI